MPIVFRQQVVIHCSHRGCETYRPTVATFDVDAHQRVRMRLPRRADFPGWEMLRYVPGVLRPPEKADVPPDLSFFCPEHVPDDAPSRERERSLVVEEDPKTGERVPTGRTE